jgi:hypothetical protein
MDTPTKSPIEEVIEELKVKMTMLEKAYLEATPIPH